MCAIPRNPCEAQPQAAHDTSTRRLWTRRIVVSPLHRTLRQPRCISVSRPIVSWTVIVRRSEGLPLGRCGAR